ncbi:MAG: histidine--tRNA ligase [Thermoflexales bacterium]
MPFVTPKPISGFPELLPAEQLIFNRCLDIVRETFEHYGFAPIETPAIERKSVLTSKGGNEKEIYALSRLAAAPGEPSDTDYALHFDLTVPFARYVAQHKDKLVFPFRRYQIQKVWRGERSQAGRYREFYQCDIDVIGRGAISLLHDAEMVAVINDVFTRLGIGDFCVRLSNRRILQGFLDAHGLQPQQSLPTLHAIDDLEKIGADQVRTALIEKAHLDAGLADALLQLIQDHAQLPADQALCSLNALADRIGHVGLSQGVRELAEVVQAVRGFGVPEARFAVDLAIVRGLDYYTGTVYETRLLAHPAIGSICSGGRYDDLAGYFTNEKLPGVGISIGLTRLVLRLLEVGVLQPGPSTPAQVLVTTMDPSHWADYLRIAAELRARGVPTEVYLDKGRLSDQLRYAARKGFAFAVIAGSDEFSAGLVKLKRLADGTERALPASALAESLQAWT